MKINFYIQIIFLLCININIISGEDIKNGLYIIKTKSNLNLCLIDSSSLFFSSQESTTNRFHIYKKVDKDKKEYDFEKEDEDKYYFIEEESTKKKLYFDELTKSVLVSDEIDTQDDSKFLWEIIPKKDKNRENYYEIKSKLKKYFIAYEESKEKTSKAFCESSWTTLSEDRSNQIKLISIYHEIEKEESILLNKEPIDVVIKYIDLNDKNLERKNLEQFDKDIQNNELKYCLRSIFQNIPWIRKIFIIMPNEKVDFLKAKEKISDKIVYIKDSDLLGFDSSSPPAFQFNLHKLKEHNLSENFILMDDDYFIGQPLKKSDLFYEEEGKIYPLIISTEYSQINFDDLKTEYMDGLNKIDDYNYNSEEGFEFRRISTLYFLYKIFDDNYDLNNIIGVGYTHNAIPLKISDIEEVYESIENHYQYSEYCLRGNKRNLRTLQPQILFMNYAKNKYDRPVNKISWKYYDLSDVEKVSLETALFVINREEKEYEDEIIKREEEILEKLFPKQIIYEEGYIDSEDDLTHKENNNVDIINDEEKNKEKEKEKIETIKEEKKDENTENDNKGEIINPHQEEETTDEEDNNNKDKKENEKEEKDHNIDIIEKEKPKETEKEKDKTKNDQEIESNDKEKLKFLDDKFVKLEEEIFNQKSEYENKFNELLDEINSLKSNNHDKDNSLSVTKLEELINLQKEFKEKIVSLEIDNQEIKHVQKELTEKKDEEGKDQYIKVEEMNTFKQIFTDIQDKNQKLEKQITSLSEENDSLNNKINNMKNSITDKDDKITKLTNENKDLKSKVKEFETQIENISKHLEKLDALESLMDINKQYEEKMNILNGEITQIKDTLNKNKINEQIEKEKEKEKENIKNKTKSDSQGSYILIIVVVFLIAVYLIYKIYYKKEDDNQSKIRHMKLSSHSGYGSIGSSTYS